MERSRSKRNIFQNYQVQIEELARLMRLLTSRDRSLPDWVSPTFLNGWVDFSVQTKAGYWRNSAGMVSLRGRIKNGALPGSCFQLPVGLRPINIVQFPVVSNGAFGVISVDTLGIVTVLVGDNISVSLGSIHFRAEQ